MNTGKKAVLVVDDEQVNRRIVKRCLEGDYAILEAGDGREALAMLDAHPDVAAILLDIIMPVMGGIEFLDELQARPYVGVPVIVMTADHTNHTELEALRHGATDFVGKPFQPQILLSRVNNAIARSQVALYEKMQYISDHDALTGLLRREKMFAQTGKLLAANPDTQFVFLRIDVDRFHLYNTSFGEAEGDRLLKHLASIIVALAESAQPSVTGRISADIFCICMPYDAAALRRQVDLANERIVRYRSDYLLKLCFGAYVVDDHALSIESLYVRATAGAKKCKGSYNTTLGIYDMQEAHRAEQEMEVTNDMRIALKEKQFVIYLQPKYELSSEQAAGAEALVRWKHPTKGLISPGLFIPIFERNGFIAELDQYIWEEVCILLRKWLDSGYTPCPVSTNISRISLYNPRLVSVLTALVKKYDLPPNLLQLEITESAYMSDPDLMQNTINGLHSAGFTLLMDDFGSGYSSLNTLKDIDVDILKIDMKFLPTTGNMERGEIILASIVRMANWLGMTVVVEGVETKRQRDFINGIGGEYIQGYYYARPMPHEEYAEKYVYAAPLPKKEDTALDTPAALLPQVAPKHNVTILVIDDDVTSRALMYTYFADQYHVQLCNSVADGLDYLRGNAHKVRLILVDNLMEGMTGMDFLEYCRTDEVLADIPKIMITANNNDADQAAAFRIGAYDYIAKPLVQEVVQARVGHVLELSYQLRSYEALGRQLRSVMQRDASTGLLSSEAFARVGTQVLLSHAEDTQAVVLISIDNLEELCADHGLAISDKVMRCVADELRAAFRKSDLIARSSANCFTVMMVQLAEKDHAKLKAATLLKSIAYTVQKQLRLEVAVSIGVAASMEDDTLNDLTERAASALDEAMNAGESHVRMYGDHISGIDEHDTSPIVLICTGDEQLFNTIALSYGEGAAFAQVTSFDALTELADHYAARIKVICLDEKRSRMPDSDQLYEYVLACGGGDSIRLYAICQEGNMEQLRHALTRNINDVITLPPQMDVIRRQLSRGIAAEK